MKKISTIYLIAMIVLPLSMMAQVKKEDEISRKEKRSEETIIVGALLNFTGLDGQSGIPNQNALQLCIDEWNAKGGILGKELQLKVIDAESNPEKASKLAKSMVDEYNPLIAYVAMTGVAVNAQPVFETNRTIQLIAAGGDVFSTKPQYTIRGYFSVYDLSSHFVKQVKETLGKRSFSVIVERNGFTEMYIEGLRKSADKEQMTINQIIEVKGDRFEYSNIIQSSSIPTDEVIYIAAPHSSMPMDPVGWIVKALHENDHHGIIASDAAINTPTARNIYDAHDDNIYFLIIDENEASEKVKEKFHEKFKSEMDERSFVMYNSLYTVLEYMERKKTMNTDEIMYGITSGDVHGVISTTLINSELHIGVRMRKVIDTE